MGAKKKRLYGDARVGSETRLQGGRERAWSERTRLLRRGLNREAGAPKVEHADLAEDKIGARGGQGKDRCTEGTHAWKRWRQPAFKISVAHNKSFEQTPAISPSTAGRVGCKLLVREIAAAQLNSVLCAPVARTSGIGERGAHSDLGKRVVGR